MKVLAGIMGCGLHSERGFHDAIRETWGKEASDAGMDVIFFMGEGATRNSPDEVILDVPDSKETLLYKVVAMCRRALDEDYDYLFKINTNTYVNMLPLFFRPPFTRHTDYSGAQVGKVGEPYGDMGIHGWIQGHASWLSRKAMEIVVRDAVPYALRNMARLMPWNGIIAPYLHSEDLWIGQVLTPYLKELTVHVDPEYGNGPVSWWSQSSHIKCYCLPEWMRAMHASTDRNATMAEYRSKG